MQATREVVISVAGNLSYSCTKLETINTREAHRSSFSQSVEARLCAFLRKIRKRNAAQNYLRNAAGNTLQKERKCYTVYTIKKISRWKVYAVLPCKNKGLLIN